MKLITTLAILLLIITPADARRRHKRQHAGKPVVIQQPCVRTTSDPLVAIRDQITLVREGEQGRHIPTNVNCKP